EPESWTVLPFLNLCLDPTARALTRLRLDAGRSGREPAELEVSMLVGAGAVRLHRDHDFDGGVRSRPALLVDDFSVEAGVGQHDLHSGEGGAGQFADLDRR